MLGNSKNCSGIEKAVEHEDDHCPNCNWCSWYCYQKIGTRTGGLGNNRTSKDCLKYSIVEIGQNTEKSPGNSETCCHSHSSEKSSAKADMKNV